MDAYWAYRALARIEMHLDQRRVLNQEARRRAAVSREIMITLVLLFPLCCLDRREQ